MYNRELSLLAFNDRVLELAADSRVPLLERLRFLCISSSNLDEFFEVRVAGLKQRIEGGIEAAGIDGLSPMQEMSVISDQTRKLVDRQYELYNNVLMPALAEHDIRIISESDWDESVAQWVKSYFSSEIQPILSPLGLDPAHPFPRLTNKSLNFIVDLEGVDAFGRDSGYALVRAPRSLPRVIPVPQNICGARHGFVLLSAIIEAQIGSLFSGMQPVGVYQFKVTRNSDLYVLEEEVANLRRALEEELVQRNFGRAVRLEVADKCPPKILEFLAQQFQLESDDIYRVHGPVNLNRLMSIPDAIDLPELKYSSFTPQISTLFDDTPNIFERINAHGSVMLHHPYQSYLPVIELVKQAASDPNVLAIKQTLYRTGHESAFVRYLTEASTAGKDVTVVIELRARFDEAANIRLATQLQEAGIQVVYGVVGFKTHAKMLHIVRREKDKLVRYVHVGTGNYHATTARAYTDISLITNEKAVTRDIERIFMQLTGLGKTRNMKSVVQSPFTLHDFIIQCIHEETRIAKSGGKGHIVARMNSLVDPAVISALYEASRSGVKIELIVRGICVLKAGIPGYSDNIRVVSVLGRFLEHSRVFYFRNGGDKKLYMSSADWMPRNFFSRVEIAVPIPREHFARVKQECLDFYLTDNQYAWQMQPDGSYKRHTNTSEPFSAQGALVERFRTGAAT